MGFEKRIPFREKFFIRQEQLLQTYQQNNWPETWGDMSPIHKIFAFKLP